MTYLGAIKQLHELRNAEDMPIYYKPAIAAVIDVLLMDAQEVRHGRWIEQEHGDWRYSKEYRCSECGKYRLVTTPVGWEWHYCPNCGADMMDGDKNERFNQQTGGDGFNW